MEWQIYCQVSFSILASFLPRLTGHPFSDNQDKRHFANGCGVIELLGVILGAFGIDHAWAIN